MALFHSEMQRHIISTVYHLAALYEFFYYLLRAIPGKSVAGMWKATLNKIPWSGGSMFVFLVFGGVFQLI